MNKLVEQLMQQSNLQPCHEAQEGQIEKFAELMLLECLKVVNQEQDKVGELWTCKDGLNIYWKMREHFGAKS